MYRFLEDFSKFAKGDVAKLPRALGGSLIARDIVEVAEDDAKPTGASNLKKYLKEAEKAGKVVKMVNTETTTIKTVPDKEPVLEPVMEPKLDKDGKPVLDKDGKPVMEPVLDKDGKPVMEVIKKK